MTTRHRSAAVVLAAALAGAAAAAPPPAAKRYAVLVGVNRYDHPKLGPLKYAEADAAGLAEVLAANKYETTVLTGAAGAKDPAKAPTKANVEAALKAVLGRCRAGDTAVIALAGHGVQFEGQKDAFFCPADGKPFPDETGSLVSLGKVYAEMDKSFAGMKVLLVDACRDDPSAGRGGVTADAAPRPPFGVAALFSCSAGQRAFEHPTLRHGVFFHHVLEGLRGEARNADGQVTFAGLAAHVNLRTARDVQTLVGNGARQTPNLKADYTAEPVLTARVRVTVAPPGGGGDYDTIGAALRAVPPDSVVLVRPGTYREGLVLDKPVEVVGAGRREEVVVEAAAADGVRMAADRAVVKGLTVRCRAGAGRKCFGVVVPAGRLTLADCDVSSDSLACVGVHGPAADPVVKGCRIAGGRAGGLVAFDRGRGTVEDCDFSGSGSAGVAVRDRADPVVKGCRIADGVLVTKDGKGTFEGCSVTGGREAGVDVTRGGDPTFRGCKVRDGRGPGVRVFAGGRGLFADCDLTDNAHAGVLVEDGGSPTVRGCRVTRNGADGVWVRKGGRATVERSDLTGNRGKPLVRDPGAEVSQAGNTAD